MKKKLTLLFICFQTLMFAQSGLIGEYFNDTELQNKVLTRTDSKIDFDWGFNGPQKGTVKSDYYSVRWTGFLLVPETGNYYFSAKFDDGIRLWVNDIPLLDAWELHDNGEFANNIYLEKNKSYSLRIEYFNAMREGTIQLLWQPPSQTENGKKLDYKKYHVVPSVNLYQTKVVMSPPPPPPPPIKPKPQNTPPSVPAPKPQENAPVFAKMDNDLSLKTVYFVQSVDKMTDNSIERLDKIVLFLQRNLDAKIALKGHTDVLGNAQSNQELSVNRAKVVANYLIAKGINEDRIMYQGVGSTEPFIANPKSEEERRLNRRVEFSIIF